MNKIKLTLISVVALFLGLSAYAQTWSAITDFIGDDPQYQTGFTLTNNADSISVVGSDATGNSFFLFFQNGAVDMSALLNAGSTARLLYTDTNVANSAYTLSLEDYDATQNWALSGFSMSDATLYSADNGSGTADLTNIGGIGLNTGGLTGSGVNMVITGFEIVPEPSTYALLAGFAAFLFVAIRRRK